jgi:hypothetical protein
MARLWQFSAQTNVCAAGDMDGQQIWKQIVEATLELLRAVRRDNEPVN